MSEPHDEAFSPSALVSPPRPVIVTSLPPSRPAQEAPYFDGRTWLRTGVLLAILLGLQFLVPRFVEEIEFARARGKQRAEYQWAGGLLREASLEGLSHSYQLVSQRVGPSVVHITIETASGEAEKMLKSIPRFRDLGGQGSGVIVDAKGHIVTNYHVIRSATSIRVALSDGRRLPARLVGADEETDLAVIKIDADGLFPADWGDSERLEVGALVWAVGSPFGLERSVTAGILSAKHRAGIAGTAYQDFLQTDAAVNPGNSGGPLIDTRGQIVGINTAIVGDTYQGISFAIPSNVAKGVFERLIAGGRVLRGWLGVQLGEMTEEDATKRGMSQATGAMVAGLVDLQADQPSPARAAGLLVGDVILRWNDREVKNSAAFSNLVAGTDIGSSAKILVNRDGKEMTFEVKVAERPTL